MFKTLEKKIIQASRRVGPAPLLSFETLLKAVSYGYGAGAVLRNKWYGTSRDGLGRYHRKSLPCPVISVGNIMAGGTGKTPMAVYIADLLLRLGKHPVVISRGYRGSLKKQAAVVSDGSQLFLDAARAGDEPFMMARLKRFPVVVGKDRYQAGCLALERLPVDVVVLDDGFQHVRLNRDLDLVLMDHDFPVGNGRVLPAGLLREPAVPALARADAVILTRCPDTVLRASHWVSGAAPGLPLFFSRHRPFLAELCPAGASGSRSSGTERTHSEPGLSLNQLRGSSVVLFSGIADNRAFFQTIRDLGANILDHLEFEDHYRYKRSDIEKIQHQARALKADMLVTTEKDRVKLDPDIAWPMDLAVVGVRISLDNDGEFFRFIDTRIQI
jgi:tetraacyldisaccharide 4'-kinase